MKYEIKITHYDHPEDVAGKFFKVLQQLGKHCDFTIEEITDSRELIVTYYLTTTNKL